MKLRRSSPGAVAHRSPFSGIGMRCLANSIDHARNRVTFGSLAQRQAIQWMLADLSIDLRTCTWLTLEAAWRADQELPYFHAAAFQETGSEDGLRSGGHRDPDSWRLCLQRVSVRRILSRGAYDAVALRARGRDRSGDRGKILAEGEAIGLKTGKAGERIERKGHS